MIVERAYKTYWYAIFAALVIVVFIFKNTLVKFLMSIFGGTNQVKPQQE
jgi:hypothetical protein